MEVGFAPIVLKKSADGRRAVGRVGREPLGPEIVPLLDPFDHRACRPDLRLPDGRRRFYIHDYSVIEVDQIVGGVGEALH